MTRPSVSVVVVSHGRPGALTLCLAGLAQVQYRPFEVVVVADAATRRVLADHALASRLKIVACDEANISRARNLGIASAGGEIVAFIDDDAVAEPDWLTNLVTPLGDDDVDAVGGFVLGRNGISFQWRLRWVDAEGWHHDLPLEGNASVTPIAPAGGAIRTEGTNMAVRRTCLASLGGFDERYRYYLDDTDFNRRLARSGRRVAIVPQALVWHHQAASSRRRADRTPTSLVEIGASTAIYLETHADEARRSDALLAHRTDQRARLLRCMVAGRLEPGDVGRILDGFDEGATRVREAKTPILSDKLEEVEFRPLFGTETSARRECLSGWSWRRRALLQRAEELCLRGYLVHLTLLYPSPRFHRRRFVEPGIWLQTGGVYGRSDRAGRLLQFWNAKDRAREEAYAGPLKRAVS